MKTVRVRIAVGVMGVVLSVVSGCWTPGGPIVVPSRDFFAPTPKFASDDIDTQFSPAPKSTTDQIRDAVNPVFGPAPTDSK